MRKHANDVDGCYYRVIDIDTGKMIANVIEADDEAGTYKVIAQDSEGKPVHCGGEFVTEVRHGNIRLEDIRQCMEVAP